MQELPAEHFGGKFIQVKVFYLYNQFFLLTKLEIPNNNIDDIIMPDKK